jgi:starch synthase (maltosyl-transferring)
MSEDAVDVVPRIYNLFPRLAGDMRSWPVHAARACAMGFDWVYLNPVHFPGFSGSCYAVQDYERIDPLLLPPVHPDKHYEPKVVGDGGLGALAETLAQIRAAGLHPMMDLVLNHTARDAPLVGRHPDWYAHDLHGDVLSPWAIDPADARKVTVWGDLAEIDNEHSRDREALWEYWTRLVERYVDLGFEGFRCDAAYKVPAGLWARLIAAARARNPNALFFGESLGARLEEVEALLHSGLHFLFNSSKYWAFDQSWCLEQQHAQAPHVRSVSFPESHDTARLWSETGGLESVQRQRYAFAAAFSSGVMMPMGYEFGFARRLDVVTTRAEDWESPQVDLSRFIARVNAARREWAALTAEDVTALGPLDQPTLLLEKRAGDSTAGIAINKDWQAPHWIELPEEARGCCVLRVCRDEAPDDEPASRRLELAPAEVVYLV